MVQPSDNEPTRAPLENSVRPLAEPFREFVQAQSASGWTLLGATAIAIILSNSVFAPLYFDILHLELGFAFADTRYTLSLQHWINDALMALFFFLLGLELKRELIVGQLSELRKALSILLAASGGVLLPATVFLLFAGDSEASIGWGIPIATDTAFAMMVLVLLGPRIPVAARAFLVGLAIIDDLAAILVIAFGYTASFNTALLVPTLLIIGVLISLNLFGVRAGLPYFVTGAVLWIAFLSLGLHGTLVGVVVAAAAPVRPAIARNTFVDRVQDRLRKFKRELDEDTGSILEQPEQQEIVENVLDIAEQAAPPLTKWESRLEKPISFVVMPLFALANAGVILSIPAIVTAWTHELSFAILFGLLVGKPLGIVTSTWIGTRVGLAELPDGLTFRHLLGLGVLGGIGFTMSLFIATLSFGEGSPMLEIAKQSIVATSLLAGLIAYAWLRWACPDKRDAL